jgi:hypothetical protein
MFADNWGFHPSSACGLVPDPEKALTSPMLDMSHAFPASLRHGGADSATGLDGHMSATRETISYQFGDAKSGNDTQRIMTDNAKLVFAGDVRRPPGVHQALAVLMGTVAVGLGVRLAAGSR